MYVGDNMTQALGETVAVLMALGKGVLAADESLRTARRRLAAVGVDDSVERRRQYRELFFTAPGLEQHVSGVILFDETFRQAAADGTPFVQLLARRGIVPGIKVDLGTVPLPNFPGEVVTEGLDGLAGRLVEYQRGGTRFTKWRAVVRIGEQLPTDTCLAAAAHVLARFAAVSQAAGLVPMMEPEVLLEGDHTLARAAVETERTLEAIFTQLVAYRVELRGVILKTSMVMPGATAGQVEGAGEVAQATVRALRACVPAEVGGVVFLSGGQTPAQATENLQAIAALGPHPWPVTFSFARALQEEALKIWRGQAEQVAAAQQAFLRRLRLVAAAREGTYAPAMERE